MKRRHQVATRSALDVGRLDVHGNIERPKTRARNHDKSISSLIISLALVALSFGVISLSTLYLKRLAADYQPEMRSSKHYA